MPPLSLWILWLRLLWSPSSSYASTPFLTITSPCEAVRTGPCQCHLWVAMAFLGSRSAICFPSHASGCLSLHEAQRTRNSVLGGTFLKACWGHVLSSTELNSPSLTSLTPAPAWGPSPSSVVLSQQPEHLEAAATAHHGGPCSRHHESQVP